jgi:coenzyme F420 hydrogenase subunit gamma
VFYDLNELKYSDDVRIKVGFFHLSSCSGCQVAFLDMFEELVDVLDTVELAYSNMLTKKREIPKLNVAFVEGSYCIDYRPHTELLKEVYEKSKVIVAIGACASFGGIRRMSVGGQAPRPENQAFLPITQVGFIKDKVRYAIPGCPPNPSLLYNFILAVLEEDEDFLNPFEYMAKSAKACGCDLIEEVVNKGLCIGCGTCVSACPTRAMGFNCNVSKPKLTPDLCVGCGSCLAACPQSFKVHPQPLYV